ncbi:OmpA family protein [Paracoccus sp. S3-43]|uniref:OmpA family protein n=1 Tax=Paracoccus sp. S3-43 TaxID=3030011 RepID=UPI0023AF3734|nr:OmpA family protein [Paracoccus sp. S3-43]WEF23503.1 OmpA family protein [Paracoccus sp. S3-43]
MNLRVTTILATAGLAALGACAPTDGTGIGTAGMSRTQQGALAGAAVGAVLAGTRDSDSNNQGRDAARGAILGAAAGAIAGNVLDRQAQALQQSVSSNVQVVNRGDHLQVILPEGILFATDSAAVTGQAQNDLYAVARNLNQYPNSRVQVVGHTDNTGSAAHNMDLSQRRAQSVASILTAAGVAPARLTATGQGFNQPVASNDTAAGRAQNRRVEILIWPTR